ncbi:hypothetical protein B0H65DRAFT_5709 [Neurospora tetraspora]|uniref:Uncharacterized protein n=1 Tax=Neurospora tetraspora TaxID=94610 RepID=A0AAE0MVA2_9PEZI|nr:hypothetical protein B0H65DRAFT_5709 [Neurospora tetraspora]
MAPINTSTGVEVPTSQCPSQCPSQAALYAGLPWQSWVGLGCLLWVALGVEEFLRVEYQRIWIRIVKEWPNSTTSRQHLRKVLCQFLFISLVFILTWLVWRILYLVNIIRTILSQVNAPPNATATLRQQVPEITRTNVGPPNEPPNASPIPLQQVPRTIPTPTPEPPPPYEEREREPEPERGPERQHRHHPLPIRRERDSEPERGPQPQKLN